MKTSLVFKRILFYILSFTWGVLMSLIGGIFILCLAPFGRVHTYHGRLYGVVGGRWGGLELGCFFLIGQDCESTCAHECGHGLQNCLWGPLMPIVISIPSAIRYQYREYLRRNNPEKFNKLPPYDSVWFEGQATEWGRKWVESDIL